MSPWADLLRDVVAAPPGHGAETQSVCLEKGGSYGV